MTSAQIIYLAPHDPRDPERWSGTIHSIYRALESNEQGIEIIPVSAGAVNFLGRATNKVLRKAGFTIDCRFSTLFALVAGSLLTVRLAFMPKGLSSQSQRRIICRI